MYRFQFRPPVSLQPDEIPLEGEPYWDSVKRRLGFWNYAEQKFNWFRIPLSTDSDSYIPNHVWTGTSLRWQRNDGQLGEAVDLKGETGEPGIYPEPEWLVAHTPYRARTVVYHRNMLWLAQRDTAEEPTLIAVDWEPWLALPQDALDALANAETRRLAVVAATTAANTAASNVTTKTTALTTLYNDVDVFVSASATTLADVQASLDAYRDAIGQTEIPALGVGVAPISGLDALNVQAALAKLVDELALRAPLLNAALTGEPTAPDADIDNPLSIVNWGTLDREIRRVNTFLAERVEALQDEQTAALTTIRQEVSDTLTAVGAQQDAFETAVDLKIADLERRLEDESISRLLELGI